MNVQGLLSDPLFLIGSGLLGNQQNPWGGATQNLLMGGQYANQMQNSEMQKKLYEMQLLKFQREIEKENKANDSISRLRSLISAPPQLQGTGIINPEIGDPSAIANAALGIPGLQSSAFKYITEGPEGDSAPKIEDLYPKDEPGIVVQSQWNPQTKKWEEVGRGPRWAPDQPPAPFSSVVQGVDPNTGKPAFYSHNSRTGELTKMDVSPAQYDPATQANVKGAETLAAKLAEGAVAGQGKAESKARVTGNLDTLADYYGQLDDIGAAINIEKGSVENVINAVAASGLGQFMGRIIGSEAQSVRNQINSMRPLLLNEIRQASEMGAKGLDSEKELEFYLQAATDPSRDLQANLAAIKVLNDAYGLGAKVNAKPDRVKALRAEFYGKPVMPETPQSGVDQLSDDELINKYRKK